MQIMKIVLAINVIFLSSFFDAEAETIFYAPSAYSCAPQGDDCVCTQNESLYFPTAFKLQNDCKYQAPFKAFFRDVYLIGHASDITPIKATAIYSPTVGESSIGAQSLVNAIAGEGQWIWDPYEYTCEANDPKSCPMVMVGN